MNFKQFFLMLSSFIPTGVLHPILLWLLLLWSTGLLRRVSTWSLVLLVHLTCKQKQEIVHSEILHPVTSQKDNHQSTLDCAIRWQLQSMMHQDASCPTVQSCSEPMQLSKQLLTYRLTALFVYPSVKKILRH